MFFTNLVLHISGKIYAIPPIVGTGFIAILSLFTLIKLRKKLNKNIFTKANKRGASFYVVIYYFAILRNTLSNITLINYTTRDFISKAELELFISKQDIYYTKEVIAKFKKAGMVRRVVTKIWNREEPFVGILF